MSVGTRGTAAGTVRLRVLDEGRGPAALLLHGFTGCAETMQGPADAISGTRRVIRPDLIGHGEGPVVSDPSAYTMRACVEQLGAMLDELEVVRCDVVGYSMGGRAALSLAVEAPGRVRSLSLIGATPGLSSATARAERIAADEALADRILEDGLEAFVDRWMALPLFASQKRLGPAALAAARAQRLRSSPMGLALSLRGMGTGAMPPLHDALSGVEVPVCLFVGEEDAKFRAIADAMAAGLPRAEIGVIASAGHAAHLEQPDAFAAALRKFLDRVSPVSGAGEPKE